MANDSRGGELLFFVAGAAVGAALGVLLAPRAGRETREQLADWLQERREQGEELLQKVRSGAHRRDAAAD